MAKGKRPQGWLDGFELREPREDDARYMGDYEAGRAARQEASDRLTETVRRTAAMVRRGEAARREAIARKVEASFMGAVRVFEPTGALLASVGAV